MKAKTYNEINGKLSEDIDGFIPTSWKLIDLVFKSLAKNHYSDFNNKVIPVDSDGVLLGSEFLEVDFYIAVEEVFKEACQSGSRKLPYEIYRIKEPSRIYDALREIAIDIIDNYNLFCDSIPTEDAEVGKKFDKIKDNCIIIKELLENKEPNNCEEYDGKSFFSRRDMRSWYCIINEKCIKAIEYPLFTQVLNNTKEDFAGVITPERDYGMAMYAFIVLLMTKRFLFAADNQQFGDCFDDGDFEYYERFWAYGFSRRINWRKDYYDIIEDSWKEYYITDPKEDNRIDVPNDVTDNDKLLLCRFLGRRVYNEIVSDDNLELILKGHSTEVNFDIYKRLRFLKPEKAERLIIAVEKELCYLYDNIEAMKNHFVDKDEAEMQQEYNKRSCDDKLRNNKAIDTAFSMNGDIDCNLIQRLFYINAYYTDIFWDQPLIYSEIVYEYVKNCIIQAERIKLIISQKIQGTSVTLKEARREETSNASFEEDMRDFLDSNNNILTKKARFSRALVKKGYVDPPVGETWETLFSRARWKELFSQENPKIENDELLELTRGIRWDKFDNKFKYRGGLQTKNQLQKAFSDGDAKNKQRFNALKELFNRKVKL